MLYPIYILTNYPDAVFVWVYPGHKDPVAPELYHLVAWQYSMRLDSKLDICHIPSFASMRLLFRFLGFKMCGSYHNVGNSADEGG